MAAVIEGPWQAGRLGGSDCGVLAGKGAEYTYRVSICWGMKMLLASAAECHEWSHAS
jgi:hypothetical protein